VIDPHDDMHEGEGGGTSVREDGSAVREIFLVPSRFTK